MFRGRSPPVKPAVIFARMTLFEFITGHVGESYERAYVWAATETRAHELFATAHPDRFAVSVRALFHFYQGEFVTKLSDSGFNDLEV